MIISNLDDFLKNPYNTIINNLTILEEKDVAIIIKDRYKLLNFMIEKEDISLNNVDNLVSGQIYWFKMEVVNPTKNNYYLLKYTDKSIKGFKLLYEENKNLKNAFSSLSFKINSSNIKKSFNNLPAIQSYFPNPFIQIGLHRGVGECEKLKIVKGRGVK